MAESFFSLERSIFERRSAAQTKERLPPSILQIGTMPYKDHLKAWALCTASNPRSAKPLLQTGINGCFQAHNYVCHKLFFARKYGAQWLHTDQELDSEPLDKRTVTSESTSASDAPRVAKASRNGRNYKYFTNGLSVRVVHIASHTPYTSGPQTVRCYVPFLASLTSGS
jgi:hypothetical protein